MGLTSPASIGMECMRWLTARIFRREDGKLLIRGEFTPETVSDLLDFFCGIVKIAEGL